DADDGSLVPRDARQGGAQAALRDHAASQPPRLRLARRHGQPGDVQELPEQAGSLEVRALLLRPEAAAGLRSGVGDAARDEVGGTVAGAAQGREAAFFPGGASARTLRAAAQGLAEDQR